MAKRQQVDFRPPEAEIRPVAESASRPFVPRLPQSVVAPVQELAGLSSILSRIAAQQGAREFEVGRQGGFDEAEGAPQDVIDELAAAHRDQDSAEARLKASNDVITKAVKAGKIHVSEAPGVHTGFVEGAATRLMKGYDAKLAARLSEAAMTEDGNGNPVIAKDPGTIVDEVWAQYKDNPILRNYYGSKIAQQIKVDADARFTSQALRQLGENRVNDTIRSSTQDLGDKFFEMQVSGQDPDETTWQTIRDWSQAVNDATAGKADRRKMMIAAIEDVASRIEGKDDGDLGFSQTAQFLRKLRPAPVGSTTAGADVEIAPKLEQMILDAERLHKSKVQDKEAAAGSEDRLAVAKGRREFLQFMQEKKKLGPVDPVGAFKEYEEKFGPAFGNRQGLVMDDVLKVALVTDANLGAVEAGNLQKQLDQNVDPDVVADQLANMAGSMSHNAYMAVDEAIEQKRSLKPFLEGSPMYQTRKDEVVAAAVIPGIPPELRDEMGLAARDQNDALVADYYKRAEAAAVEWATMPKSARDAAQRAWYNENVPALKQQLTENGRKFLEAQNTAVADINKLLRERQDPRAVIQANRDVLGARQVQNFESLAVEATNYQGMTRTAPYQDGSRIVGLALETKYAADPEKNILVEAGLRALNKKFTSTIAEKLAGQDPSKADAIIYEHTKELSDEVLEEVENQRLTRYGGALEKGGETLEEAKQSLNDAAADLQVAVSAQQTPEKAADAIVDSRPMPHISDDLVDMQKGLISRERRASLGFARVRDHHVLDRAYAEVRTVLLNPAVDPTAKGQAAVDSRRGVVLPMEDVVAGKMRLAPSEHWRSKVKSYAEGMFGGPGAVLLASGNQQLTAKMLQQEFDRPPLEVDISKAKIGPYTQAFFRTSAELRQWVETRKPELWNAARGMGVPLGEQPVEGDRAFKEFLRRQEEMIRLLDQSDAPTKRDLPGAPGLSRILSGRG